MGKVIGLCGLGQCLDDTFAWENAAVYNMSPFGDAEGAAVVLFLDGVADVDEFAVFEDEEVVFFGERFQTGDCFGTEVGNDVDVGFYHGDVGTKACKNICESVVP